MKYKRVYFFLIIILIFSLISSSLFFHNDKVNVSAQNNKGKTVILDAGHGGLTNTIN